MENEIITKKSTVFLNIYKFLFDVTYYAVGSATFTWDTFEKIIDKIITVLQSSIQNNTQIGLDPLLDYVMEEITALAPKEPLSPAQWKQKRIAGKYQKLDELYNEVRVPKVTEEAVEINNINDYFKEKKFIQISTIGEYLNSKPLDLKYYDNLAEFLRDIKKIINNKYNSYYKIRQFYMICQEITTDIPNILLDNKIDSADFDYINYLCKQFLNKLVHHDYLAINYGGTEDIEYQKTRIIKLNRINNYSDNPYINR